MSKYIVQKNREREQFRKKVRKIADVDQRNTVISCLYINKLENTKRISKLFKLDEDDIIQILKQEQLYEYKICSCCGKLKSFDEYFKRASRSAYTEHQSKCKECTGNAYHTDKTREYGRNHIKEFRKNPVQYDRFVSRLQTFDEIRENNNGILETTCAYCGKWFIPLGQEVELRLNAINGKSTEGAENRFYCSNNCKSECPIYKRSAKSIYLRELELAGKIINKRAREVQPELRKMRFEMDDYTCQKCNTHQSNLNCSLHCHHIEGVQWEPLESADLDMCITYCKDCHDQVHTIPGCGYHEFRCSEEFKVTCK